MLIGPGNQNQFNRGPYYEAMQKFAPILAAVLFAVVAAALLINFVQSRRHPEDRPFDPAKNFSRINSRGMVDVMMKRSDENK